MAMYIIALIIIIMKRTAVYSSAPTSASGKHLAAGS